MGTPRKLDGTHIPLTNEEADAIVEQSRQTKARRDEAMPETESALNQFMDAWTGLVNLAGGVAFFVQRMAQSLPSFMWEVRASSVVSIMGNGPRGV